MLNHGQYSTVKWLVEGEAMLIGEFAKACGLSRDAIRFYEKIGLISAAETRRGPNNYKHYDPSLIDRMELVRKAKVLGFTLTEIAKLVRDWESGRFSLKEKRTIISDKIRVVDEKLREIQKVRQYLEEKLSCLGHGGTSKRRRPRSVRGLPA